MQLKNKPLVAIYMITYNHENYISQAIESALMQKTTFHFKLFIGEDFSSDNTRNICIEYKNKYPEKIELLLQEKNIGATQNAQSVYKLCFESGADYVALLEGDDYWIDPYKLQKQVDFLEANPDFSICFHKAAIYYEENITPFYPDINKETKEVTTLENIVKGNYIHTPTVVFRKNMLKLPDWFKDAYPGDWALHILNATYGKIKFFPEEMAVYRVHQGGIHSMSTGNTNYLKTTLLLKFLGKELKRLGHDNIGDEFLKKYYYLVAYVYGLNSYRNNTFSKFTMAYNLLFYGDLKMKLCCWFPLVFGDKTHVIHGFIRSRITPKFR